MLESKEDMDRLIFYSSKFGSTKIDRLMEFFSMGDDSDVSDFNSNISDLKVDIVEIF